MDIPNMPINHAICKNCNHEIEVGYEEYRKCFDEKKEWYAAIKNCKPENYKHMLGSFSNTDPKLINFVEKELNDFWKQLNYIPNDCPYLLEQILSCQTSTPK